MSVALSSLGHEDWWGKKNEMERKLDFLKWNFFAAEGPPAHNPTLKTIKQHMKLMIRELADIKK